MEIHEPVINPMKWVESCQWIADGHFCMHDENGKLTPLNITGLRQE